MPSIKTLDAKLLAGIAPGTWVAISQDQERIVGQGGSIDEALERAKLAGEEHPFLVRVPAAGSALIL